MLASYVQTNSLGQVHQGKTVSFLMMNIFAFVYISTAIFYITRSGLPQIADIGLALGILIMLFEALTNNKMALRRSYFVALVFASLTFTINFIYFVFYSDIQLLLSSIY